MDQELDVFIFYLDVLGFLQDQGVGVRWEAHEFDGIGPMPAEVT